MSGQFEARFGSGCLACGDRIHEGDKVKWADGAVIHADCAIYDDRMVEVPPTCPICFEVPAVNGSCGCSE